MPWDRLDEQAREKDRDAFRALPALLARVGYEVVVGERMPDASSEPFVLARLTANADVEDLHLLPAR